MTDINTPASAPENARRRMVEAAKRYAAADRTDPFAFRRAMTHIDNGLARVMRQADAQWGVAHGPAYYDAEPLRELRKVTGFGGAEMEVDVVVYRNVVRP